MQSSTQSIESNAVAIMTAIGTNQTLEKIQQTVNLHQGTLEKFLRDKNIFLHRF